MGTKTSPSARPAPKEGRENREGPRRPALRRAGRGGGTGSVRRRWSGEGTGNGFTSAAAAPLPSELRLAPYRRRGGASRGRGRAPPPLNPYSCRRHRARHRPLRGTEDSRKREGQRRRRRKPGNAHCAGARRQRTRRGGEGGAVHCAHARPRRDVLGADCPAGGGGGWIVSAHACGGGRRAAPSTLGLRACGREVAYIQCVSPPRPLWLDVFLSDFSENHHLRTKLDS